ncbi:hypothetical protein HDU67_004818, partial [Dinochytrium kinnereticum]
MSLTELDADPLPESSPPTIPMIDMIPKVPVVTLPTLDLDDIKTTYIPAMAWGEGFLKELDDRLYVQDKTKKGITFSMILRGENDGKEEEEGDAASEEPQLDAETDIVVPQQVKAEQRIIIDAAIVKCGDQQLSTATTHIVNPSLEAESGLKPRSVAPMAVPMLVVSNDEDDDDGPSIPIFTVTDVDTDVTVELPKVESTSHIPSTTSASAFPILIQGRSSEHISEHTKTTDALDLALGGLLEGDFKPGERTYATSQIRGIWMLLEKESSLELEIKEKKRYFETTMSEIQFVKEETR